MWANSRRCNHTVYITGVTPYKRRHEERDHQHHHSRSRHHSRDDDRDRHRDDRYHTRRDEKDGRFKERLPQESPEERQRRIEREENYIKEAERSKLNQLRLSGKNDLGTNYNIPLSCYDDEFFQSIAHLDDQMVKKIEKGEYVELEKIQPKNKVTSRNNQLEMVYKEGYSFLVPAADKDLQVINSFKWWEVAFRMYTGIFTRANRNRATDIFQYADSILEAADSSFGIMSILMTLYTDDLWQRTHLGVGVLSSYKLGVSVLEIL